MNRFACIAVVLVAGFSSVAQLQTPGTLNIYSVDVEGGNATLFVAPSGESLLIDTGHGGPAGARDALRIQAAAKDAGLSRIDHLVLTHYHLDHYGGLTELANRIPIRHFIDHGENVESTATADARFEALLKDQLAFLRVYAQLWRQGAHTVAMPGDRIAVQGLDVRVVTSAGRSLRTPIPGAGQPNPYCAAHEPMAPDTSENAQSVGLSIVFGRFHALFLGDLSWNREYELMCPNNPVGDVDLFIMSQHGASWSNSPVLVHAIAPRAALVSTGPRKGAHPSAMRVLRTAPRFEDVWQIHFSLLSGQEYTAPGMFIANTVDDQPPVVPIAPMPLPPFGPDTPPAPTHNGPAYWLKVSAEQDGTFTVTNARNGFSKVYRKRPL